MPKETQTIEIDGKKYTATVVYEIGPSESEPSPFLRSLRNFIGYGVGWKFKDALWDWVHPKLIGLVIAICLFWIFYNVAYISSHIRVIWVP